MRPDGFVLAGGRSARMGSDKARADWGGVSMAVAVASVLSAVCGRVALIRRGDPDGLPWVWPGGAPLEVLREEDAGEPHPLYGVATALAASATEVVLLAPCDVPCLRAEDVAALIAAAPAVASVGARRHPLVAALPRAWAGAALDAARAGQSVRAFTAALPAIAVPEDSLANLNDPAALLAARRGLL